MIDQRTTNRNYPVPHPDNMLDEDVSRIKDSFEKIDIDVNDLYGTTTQSIEDAQSGAYWFGSSTGTGASYEINLNPAPTTLNMGMFIYMKAHAKNSGSATVNVNSLGVKNVKKIDGSDLKQGDIPENGIVTLVYDGTNFQLVSSAMDKEQTGVNTSNIMRAFEEIQENHGGSLLMEAGWSDSFSNPDEQGADEGSSSGYQHDPTNTLYKGSDPGIGLNSDKNFDTESDYLQQEWTNTNQVTSQVDFSDTSVSVPTLDQSSANTSANEPVNNNSGGLYRAMTFTAGATGDLSKISLNLIKNGSPDSGATFTAEIRSTSSDQPTTTVLSSTEAISVGSIGSSSAWYDFIFSTKPNLTSGTKYAIVVTASYGASGTNNIGWSNDNNSNTYANGSGYHSSDSISWSLFGNYDYAFKTYVDSVFVTKKRAKLSSGAFPTNCENARISFDSGTSWFDIESRDSDTQLALVGDLTKGQTYSASTSGGGGEDESKAFDDNSGTYWNPTNSNTLPQWLKVEYSSATVINKINLNWYDTATYTYTFEGSNDDVSYTTLLTIAAKSYTANTLTSETFVNTTAYKYYRINITAKIGGGYVIIREMEMLHIPVDGAYDYIIRMSELDSNKVQLNAPGIPNGLDENTVLLVHMDGTDGSTTFTDVSSYGHILTASNTDIDTAQSKFGSGSMLSDGSSSKIDISNHSVFDFQANDWTVDLWVRFNSLSSTSTFYDYSNHGGDYIFFEWKNTNLLQVYGTTIGTLISEPWTPSLNTWYHIAYVRHGDNWMVFVDGIQKGTTKVNAVTITTKTLPVIGYNYSASPHHDGWMDEFRISNIARWTSNFTPSDSPYSAPPNPISEYVSICDSESHKTSASGWLDINSGSATEKLNSQEAYYWLGFDPASGFGDGTEIKIGNNKTGESITTGQSDLMPETYFTNAYINKTFAVGNNQVITHIGLRMGFATAPGASIKIYRENSATDFDVLYTEVITPVNNSAAVTWYELTNPYLTPSTGVIRLGAWFVGGTSFLNVRSTGGTSGDGVFWNQGDDLAVGNYTNGSVSWIDTVNQLCIGCKTGTYDTGWRTIAKNESNVWKYNNSSNGFVFDPVGATTNDMLHAVSEAIAAQPANRMKKEELELIMGSEWEGTGGWSTSVNSIIRGVTLYSNASTQSPSVSQYRLNYDSQRGAMDLRSKTYDPGFEPSESYVWSRIEHSDSDGPGTFYATKNGGTEWTAVPMVQQGSPLSGDIRIYRGTVDINGQASGQDLRCRYETEIGKDQFLHSWGLQAKS
jgi:hypothetical protein